MFRVGACFLSVIKVLPAHKGEKESAGKERGAQICQLWSHGDGPLEMEKRSGDRPRTPPGVLQAEELLPRSSLGAQPPGRGGTVLRKGLQGEWRAEEGGVGGREAGRKQ